MLNKQQRSPFKWSPNGVRYLGTIVDSNLKNLYTLDCPTLHSEIVVDLQKWINLPITLIGRINCVKMNILPRLQYLFQSLSTPVPHSCCFF